MPYWSRLKQVATTYHLITFLNCYYLQTEKHAINLFWCYMIANNFFFSVHDDKQVVALPLPHRPLFPGFYMPIYVKVRYHCHSNLCKTLFMLPLCLAICAKNSYDAKIA